MSRTVKFIFTASLLLNALFLGASSGLAYQHWSAPGWHDLKKDLSPEVRDLMMSSFKKSHPDMRALADEAKQKRLQAVDIMNAENFDEAAFDQAVADLTAIQNKMIARKLQMIKEISGALPAEERRKLSEKMVGSLDRSIYNKRKHYDHHKKEAQGLVKDSSENAPESAPKTE
jgi:uncharacterized membrane protein